MPLETGASIATRLIRSGESMKVRILRDGAFKAGEVVDLHDDIAAKWIASQLAVPVMTTSQDAELDAASKASKGGSKPFVPLNKRKKG